MKDSTGVLPPVIEIRGCMLWPRYMAYFMSSFRLALQLLDTYTMFASLSIWPIQFHNGHPWDRR